MPSLSDSSRSSLIPSDAFFADQISYLFDQAGFVDLVRQFRDHDRFAPALVEWLDAGARADIHATSPRSIS
jgi:hypothetical protein